MLQKSDLHKYQQRAVNHIINNTHCSLWLEMGLGKSICSLTAIEHLLFEELEISSVLVIAPKRVAESVWDAEVANWAHINHLTVSKITGTVKQRKAALRQKAHIYTLGRDNVVWLCGLYGGSRLPFDMLVIDELSSFKNHQSKRFKALKMVQPSFKRVVGLTGTPAPNGLIDLWSQMYLIDRGERLGKYITEYRRNFFSPGKSNGHIVYKYDLRKGAAEQIYEAIDDIVMSMKAKDYLDLPERIDNIIKLPFDEKLQERYNDFEREKVLEILEEQEGDEISAANAAALSNKLLQFANGAVYNDRKEYKHIHDLKIDALKEIIEDANGQPVLIAYTFISDRERMLEALKKYKPKVLDGQKDIDDWNAGKIQVMIMHPASAGHGLNLQHGGHIIVWFGQTWSLELEQQFNARLDRQGQTESVVINKLVASKTIDELVIKRVAGKDKTQNGLMDAMKATIEKYKSTK